MAGLQLSGLASGLDWQSLINNLIAADSVPVTTMQKTQTTNKSIVSALTDLSSQLTALQTEVTSDFSDSNFNQRVATSSTSGSTWEATSSAGGTTGSFSFDVTSIATSAKQIGKASVTGGINATSDVSGLLLSSVRTAQTITAGTFTVNGSQVTIATTDSLKDVFDKISTATSGAVTGSYDPASDKVTLSGTGTITLGTSIDTSNFLSAMGLYQNGGNSVSSGSSLGTSNLSVPLASAGLKTAISAVDGSGNGSFSINGKTVSYNVNTDSIQSVLSKINTSGAGVTASYDYTQDRYTLKNNSTGNINIYASETGTGFLSAVGLTGSGSTFQSGTNAVFSVNGGNSITTTSNTFTSTVTGITGLSLTVDQTGTQTINVAPDTSSATTKINSLITKYNSIQTAIKNYTAVTVKKGSGVNGDSVAGSVLAGNLDIEMLSDQLRSIMFKSIGSLSGSVKSLNNLGIDFSSSSPDSLAVTNATKLSSALSNAGADVGDFFTNSSSGLITQLKSFITKATSTTGSLSVQIASKNSENSNLDTSIANYNRQLDAERSQLTAAYIAMEKATSSYQSQAAQLTAAFSGSSSSSK